jgi:hypothetical protein
MLPSTLTLHVLALYSFANRVSTYFGAGCNSIQTENSVPSLAHIKITFYFVAVLSVKYSFTVIREKPGRWCLKDALKFGTASSDRKEVMGLHEPKLLVQGTVTISTHIGRVSLP